MQSKPSGLALSFGLGIAILAVSTASILIRFAQRDAPSITIAALRLAIAALLLAPVVLARHRAELRTLDGRRLGLAVLAGIFLAVHFATWISSLEFTTVVNSVVLVSTGPLWVALLSPLLLRERLSSAALAGLALAVIGGVIIAGSDVCTWGHGPECNLGRLGWQNSSMWGNFLALVGAWAVSGYLIIGRQLRPNLSLLPYIFLVYGCAAIFLIASGALSGSLVLALPARAYAWILLLAIVPQLIGHSTYNWALRYLPAAFVAVTTLGEPLGSAILAYFILRETPGPLVLLGAILILSGIYAAARNTRSAETATG